MAEDEEFQGYKEQLQAFTEGKQLLYNFNANNNDDDPKQQGRDTADTDVQDLAETFRVSKARVAEDLLSAIQTLQIMAGLRGSTYERLRERAIQSVSADLKAESTINLRPSINLPRNNIPSLPPTNYALQQLPPPSVVGFKRRINSSRLDPLASQKEAAQGSGATLQKWQTMFDWFKALMEELEPVHDCPFKRVDYLCRIVNKLPSTINWEVLNVITDDLDLPEPPTGRTIKDLEAWVLTIANAIAKGKFDVTEIEEAVPICCGQFIMNMMPNEFTYNIYFRPTADQTSRSFFSTNSDNLRTILETLRPTLVYYEAGGIANYGAVPGLHRHIQATTYVDPSISVYRAEKPLKYIHTLNGVHDNEMDEILGDIQVDVTKDNTQVKFSNFPKYTLKKFPTTKLAAIVAELIKAYAQWTQSSNTSANTSTEEPTPRRLRGQMTHKPEKARFKATNSRDSVVRALKLKVVELYRYLDDPEADLDDLSGTTSSSQLSQPLENSHILAELYADLNQPIETHAGILAPQSILRPRPRQSPPPPSPISSNNSNHNNNSVLLTPRGKTLKFSRKLNAEERTKLERNKENMIQLMELAVAIYDDRAAFEDPEQALAQTIRILLHLKSYGDELQLRELNDTMQKRRTDTLLLEANDRILLGLAGLYAVRNGWNLLTLGGSGVVRDYRTAEAAKAAKEKPISQRDLEAAKAAAQRATAANLAQLFEQNVAEEEQAGRRAGRTRGRSQAQILRDQRLQTITNFNNARNGFRIIEVADDGTCFFKAIIQDNKTGKTFRDLRAVLGNIEWGGSPDDIRRLSDYLQRDILTIIQNPDQEEGGYIFDIERRYPASPPIYIFDHAGPIVDGQVQRHFDAVTINNPVLAAETIEEAGAAPVNISPLNVGIRTSPFIPIGSSPSPHLVLPSPSPRPPSASPVNYTPSDLVTFIAMFLNPATDPTAIYEAIQARSPRFFNKGLEMAVAQNVEMALDALERLITYVEDHTDDSETAKRFKKQSEAIRTKFGKNARNLYLLKREGRWRETKRTKLLRRARKQKRRTQRKRR